jgi:hypothetical protein
MLPTDSDTNRTWSNREKWSPYRVHGSDPLNMRVVCGYSFTYHFVIQSDTE